ncbi:MAG TPA: hypothetical protein VN130_11490 [Xanthobacteraceae bacterium]|nr:hypothetical protein [Xanthobacteraceae bacterium]
MATPGSPQSRRKMIDPVIDGADDRIKRRFADDGCGKQLTQIRKYQVLRVKCQRPATHTEHPAVELMPPRPAAKPRRQMHRLPRQCIGIAGLLGRLAASDERNLGKRRRKDMIADIGQPADISQNKKMIDKRSMPIARLQFGVDGKSDRAGVAVHHHPFFRLSPDACIDRRPVEAP